MLRLGLVCEDFAHNVSKAGPDPKRGKRKLSCIAYVCGWLLAGLLAWLDSGWLDGLFVQLRGVVLG